MDFTYLAKQLAGFTGERRFLDEAMTERIAQAYAGLPELDRQVLAEKFGMRDGRRQFFAEIARRHSVTTSRVLAVQTRALQALATSLS